MKITKIIIGALLTIGSTMSAFAQTNIPHLQDDQQKTSKAWEFGLGGSIFQFNRTSFSNFNKLNDGGYQFDLDLKHAVYGGNIYLARELNSQFYLDLQGTTGFTKESLNNDDKTKWFYMLGLGIQWRFGQYFGSKYIDPYLRAGINYMHKDFGIFYTGEEGLAPDEMKWVLENVHNKSGIDRKDLMPISLGGGINMWLNDRLGVGLEADYLLMPYKDVANSFQGTVRIMYRIGGKSKKPIPQIEYVETEKVIEKRVEVPVVVEKIVEVPGKTTNQTLCDYFNSITFEFDKDNLTPESEKIIDDIATILKQDPSKKYLITGYTDSKGAASYNENLSQRRAETISKALIDRGIDKIRLKSRGVGSKISVAQPNVADNIRDGDRKVTIESITNTEYWDYLPDNNQ